MHDKGCQVPIFYMSTFAEFAEYFVTSVHHDRDLHWPLAAKFLLIILLIFRLSYTDKLRLKREP
jgi:hypothetical protein